MEKFVDLSQTPSLAAYVNKLNNSRKKMININTTLRQIQNRLDRIYSTHGNKPKETKKDDYEVNKKRKRKKKN